MGKTITFNLETILKEHCEKEGNYIYLKKNKKLLLTKKKSRRSTFTFPTKVTIKPSTIGLIVGEGYVDKKRFVFANSNEMIIKQLINFFQKFGITPNYMLEISVKNVEKTFMKTALRKWQKITKNRINKTRIRKEFNNTTEKGTITLSYYNTCFSIILARIIKKTKKMVENDTKLAISYLKGILAAEGNVNIKKKTKCVYMVRISEKKKSEREHYKRCLRTTGIKIYCKDMPSVSKKEGVRRGWKTKHGRAGCVIISRWKNFVKILMNDLLELHREKEESFLNGFKQNLYTRLFLDFEQYINKEFTLKDMEKCFGLTNKPIQRADYMIQRAYLTKDFRKEPYRYRLTEKYLLLYNKIKQYPIFQ